MNASHLIVGFLQSKRFAMLGVSRNPRDFSRRLYDEFLKRGYDVIAVNPATPAIDGKHCFKRVQDIQPPVTCALLMTPRAATDKVLLDCADAGITLVWIYGISGEKDISPNAIKICREHGMEIVPGYCPFMFMPMTALYHRVHGFVWKAIGKYLL